MSSVTQPHPLHTLLKPQSVAVIGASPDKAKIRGELFHFMHAGGYKGRLYPVNPSYQDIHGIKCYPDVGSAAKDAGGSLDLALVAIPANVVMPELERCAAAGVKNVVVVTAGFAEEGGESAKVQEQMAALARRTGMRISGPNSEGYFNAIDRVNATFSPTVERVWGKPAIPYVSDKRIAVVAQSGGMGFAIFNHGTRQGLQYSYIITSGNEADLTMAEYVDFLVDDPDTAVIALFCETIRGGEVFERAALRALQKGKPIVAIKAGQSVAGQRATASHTAAIAGWSAAYDAVFAKYGVIQTQDVDETSAVCGILVTSPMPRGNNTVVMTVSGGAGAIVSDTLERNGFTMPILPEAFQKDMRQHIPSFATPQNPVDLTAAGNRSGAYALVIDYLAQSEGSDLVVVVNSLSSDVKIPIDPHKISGPLKKAGKPFASFSYTMPSDFTRSKMAEAGIYVNGNLRAMGSALGKILAHAKTAPPDVLPPLESPGSLAALTRQGDSVLCEYEVKDLLRSFGVDASREALAGDADAAVAAANQLGYPVALKFQSPEVTHKTEMGGVALNIGSDEALRKAYADMVATVKKRAGDVASHGILVQKMAPAGYEVIVGMINDATWGPLMMVGMGGVAVELFKDVAYRPAPVSPREAEAMLRSLKSAALFDGFRGKPVVDLAPLAQLVSTVSRIAAAHRDSIAEMELNPVIVHADGSGITIADALLKKAS